MANDNLPDLGDPSEVVDDLEPEVVSGPLGFPVLKPKGAPNPPGGSGMNPFGDY